MDLAALTDQELDKLDADVRFECVKRREARIDACEPHRFVSEGTPYCSRCGASEFEVKVVRRG